MNRGRGRGGFRGNNRGGRGGHGNRPGGRPGAGAKGKAKTVVLPHRIPGTFIAKAKEDMLCTLRMAPGETVYGEAKVIIEDKTIKDGVTENIKTEYPEFKEVIKKMSAEKSEKTTTLILDGVIL